MRLESKSSGSTEVCGRYTVTLVPCLSAFAFAPHAIDE